MLKIGFLATQYYDPDRVTAWSGLPYYFAQGLRQAGCEVVSVRARREPSQFWPKVRQAAWQFLRGRRYLRHIEPGLMRAEAAGFEAALAEMDVDIVFAATSWLAAELGTDRPIVFWSDATFAIVQEFYPSFSNLAAPSVARGEAVEQAALQRCALAVYSSNWAANSAIKDYGASPDKVLFLPFGANIEWSTPASEVKATVARRPTETCELLLIGVDWERKGAPVAVQTARALTALGIPCRLRIVGCRPPRGYPLPPYVEMLPFVSKVTAEGRRQLEELYRGSHFFILPSRAEASAVVLQEACSMAVPCLTTDVGGLADIIINERNGHRFPLTAGGDAYAAWVAEVWRDQRRYRTLCYRASRDYWRRLRSELSFRELAARMATLRPTGNDQPAGPALAGLAAQP